MGKREDRKSLIRMIVRTYQVRTQRDLVDYLAAEGCKCTQATISRDVSDMGLLKTQDGVYVLPQDMHLKKLLMELVKSVDRAGNMVVVKVVAGGASVVAEAIDSAELPYLLGTVAGDDTIFCVSRTEDEAKTFVNTIETFTS